MPQRRRRPQPGAPDSRRQTQRTGGRRPWSSITGPTHPTRDPRLPGSRRAANPTILRSDPQAERCLRRVHERRSRVLQRCQGIRTPSSTTPTGGLSAVKQRRGLHRHGNVEARRPSGSQSCWVTGGSTAPGHHTLASALSRSPDDLVLEHLVSGPHRVLRLQRRELGAVAASASSFRATSPDRAPGRRARCRRARLGAAHRRAHLARPRLVGCRGPSVTHGGQPFWWRGGCRRRGRPGALAHVARAPPRGSGDGRGGGRAPRARAAARRPVPPSAIAAAIGSEGCIPSRYWASRKSR